MVRILQAETFIYFYIIKILIVKRVLFITQYVICKLPPIMLKFRKKHFYLPLFCFSNFAFS